MIDIALTVRHDEGALTLSFEGYPQVSLGRNVYAVVNDLLESLEEDAAASGNAAQTTASRRLEGIGEELFEELVPNELGDRLRALVDGAATVPAANLHIRSNETFIPWELLRIPGRAPESPAAEVSGIFLTEAFCLTRWLDGSEPARDLPLREIALVTARETGLAHVEQENDSIRLLADPRHRVTEVGTTASSMVEALSSGRYDGCHFTGHGFFSFLEPSGLSRLQLDDSWLNSYDLPAASAGIGKTRPLVFANACHSGRGGPGLTRTGGLARAFLKAGAGAYVGAHWGVRDASASKFAFAFYRGLLIGRLSIGEAIHQARTEIRKLSPDDPTWLAYTVFAHPHASSDAPRPTAEPMSLSPVALRRLPVVFLALLPVLLLVLGSTIHRSRETMLRISALSYPASELLSTGAQAVGDLFVNGLTALLSSRPLLQGSAWSLVGLAMLCLVATRWQHGWRSAGYVAMTATATVLWVGVHLYTFALRARHPEERPAETSALCSGDFLADLGDPAPITELIVVESCSWLVHPTSTNEEWRQSLSGLALYFLLASGSALWCGIRMGHRRGWRENARRLLIGVNVVVLLLVLRQVPLAHSYSRWGLEYPSVDTAGHCEDELVEPLKAGICCAYDVSAGAKETVLLVRGAKCPVAGQRILDATACSLKAGLVTAVTQGCP